MKSIDSKSEQVKQLIQAMPKFSKYLTRDEIRLRIEILASLCPPKKNAVRS